jgi:hypothetical protein
MKTIRQSLSQLFNQIIFLQLRLILKLFLLLTKFRMPSPNPKIMQLPGQPDLFSHIKPGTDTPRPRRSSRLKAGQHPSPMVIQSYTTIVRAVAGLYDKSVSYSSSCTYWTHTLVNKITSPTLPIQLSPSFIKLLFLHLDSTIYFLNPNTGKVDFRYTKLN